VNEQQLHRNDLGRSGPVDGRSAINGTILLCIN
jgi:hypothetical protein